MTLTFIPAAPGAIANIHTEADMRQHSMDRICAAVEGGVITVTDYRGPVGVSFKLPVDDYLAHVDNRAVCHLSQAISILAAGLTRYTASSAIDHPFERMARHDIVDLAYKIVDDLLMPSTVSAGEQVTDGAALSAPQDPATPLADGEGRGKLPHDLDKQSNGGGVSQPAIADRRAVSLKGWETRRRKAAAAKRAAARKKSAAAKRRRS